MWSIRNGYLSHSGILGMKWGIRRYQNPDGSLTPEGKERYYKHNPYRNTDSVFVSGKVQIDGKMIDRLPSHVKRELRKITKRGSKIIIGDAPGADTAVQRYLSKLKYRNVEVYTADKEVRNNVGNWKVKQIKPKKTVKWSNLTEDEQRQLRALKDIAMTNAATRGLAISSADDRPDSAMSNNVRRLANQGTPTRFYDYKKGVWLS